MRQNVIRVVQKHGRHRNGLEYPGYIDTSSQESLYESSNNREISSSTGSDPDCGKSPFIPEQEIATEPEKIAIPRRMNPETQINSLGFRYALRSNVLQT